MSFIRNHHTTLLCFTFQKFNEIIDTSRAEADRAEANITEIERLISSANNKSDEAAATLETTENLAMKAKTTAEEANETANRTRQVSCCKSIINEFGVCTAFSRRDGSNTHCKLNTRR